MFRRPLMSACLLLVLAAAPALADDVAVIVQSSPAGARVFVDGREQKGLTPLRLSLPRGDHEVALRKDGFLPAARLLQVSGRGFASFELIPVAAPTVPAAPSTPVAPAPPAAPPAPPATSPVSPAFAASASAVIAAPVPAAAGSGAAAGPVRVLYRHFPRQGGVHEPARPAVRANDNWNLLPRDNPFAASLKPRPRAALSAPALAAPASESGASVADLFPLVVRDSSRPALSAGSRGDEEIGASEAEELQAALETEVGAEALLLAETSSVQLNLIESVPAMPPPALEPLPEPRAPAPRRANPVLAPPAPFCAPSPEVEWPEAAEDQMASAAAALPRFPERFNLLLLGLDRRDRRGILATGAEIPLEQLKRIPARSDVIMVIQFDFLEQQIRIVNIPRDTRLRVGGRGGWKINAAYAFGRERLARKVVADFLDLPIHRCVVADWRGAKQCIALFKGLNFDYQGFSEKDIFWHLRKRSFARGDFQRIERQQRFLNFAAGEYLRLYRQVRSASGAAGMVRQGILEMAIKQALAAVETDLGYDEMRLLTYAFRDYDPARMVMTQVPGVGVLEGGSAEGGGIYYLSPTPRHSFKDLIYRAESKGMAGNSGPSPIYSNMD